MKKSEMLLMVITLVGISSLVFAGGTAQRSFSAGCYDPLVTLQVSIYVVPDAGTSSWACDDQPPSGWTASNISDSGVWDDVNKKVKWVFIGGAGIDQPKTLTYDITPPSDASGLATFSGRASFDGPAFDITGETQLDGCAPVADFSGTPTSGCNPLTVDFTDLSTNNPTSWSWNFGDGNSSTDQNPSHQYTAQGSYTVSLTAQNDYGQDTETKTDYITVNDVPTADFSSSAGPTPTPTPTPTPSGAIIYTTNIQGDYCAASQTFTVDVAVKNNAQNPVMAYQFNVHYDSGSVTLQSVADVQLGGNAPVLGAVEGSGSDTWRSVGTLGNISNTLYNLTLCRLTFQTTASPASSYRIWITDDSPNIPLVDVNFSQIPNSYDNALTDPLDCEEEPPWNGCAPLVASFTDLSTDNGSPITGWLWDFGDGYTSTDQNPSHQYDDPGEYTVSLTVQNSCGQDTETKVDHIAVPGPPIADFSATPLSGCAPLTVDFTDLSDDNNSAITSWSWNFGDGNTSTDQNPSHQYANAGTYTVTLTVENGCGEDSEVKIAYIIAANAPVADFIADNTSGCAPLTVNFTDLSTNNPTSWSWDFGDGNGSSDQNPSHQYANAGTYTVSLTVQNACNLDTEIKINYITVADPPVADFIADKTSGCVPLIVNFTDRSTTNSTSWSWNFGDGNGSSAQNPSHQYTAAGTYTVSLTVQNACGQDTETKIDYITVSDVPDADFSATPVSGCIPLTVNFTDLSNANYSAITSWSWNFGDGNSSNLQNPSHQYTTDGSFTVSLTVVNGCGQDTETKIDYINIGAPQINVIPTGLVDYGWVVAGDTLCQDYIVQNIGCGSFSGEASSSDPDHFAVQPPANYTLAQDEITTITVCFSPDSATSFTAILTFTGGGDETVDVMGNGFYSHCADLNGDMRIVANEITQYASDWKLGNHDCIECVTHGAYIYLKSEKYKVVGVQDPDCCKNCNDSILAPDLD